MAWEWQPDGLAAGDFDTVQAAADALGSSARRTFAQYDQLAQRHVMLSCIGPLQERMLTEGAESIAAGKPWSGRCAGVRVTLSPR
ncbi:hypothetical protein ACWEN3_45065 [Streptomyces sp. NPDC004561]